MQTKSELRRRGYRLTKTRKTPPGLPMELIGKSGTVIPTRRKPARKNSVCVEPLDGKILWLMTNFSLRELIDESIAYYMGARGPSDPVFEAASDQILHNSGVYI